MTGIAEALIERVGREIESAAVAHEGMPLPFFSQGCETRSLGYYASVGIDHFNHDHARYESLLRLAARAAIAIVVEEAAKCAEEQAAVFLDPEYAGPDPLSSFCERFACGRVAAAIRLLAAEG